MTVSPMKFNPIISPRTELVISKGFESSTSPYELPIKTGLAKPHVLKNFYEESIKIIESARKRTHKKYPELFKHE